MGVGAHLQRGGYGGAVPGVQDKLQQRRTIDYAGPVLRLVQARNPIPIPCSTPATLPITKSQAQFLLNVRVPYTNSIFEPPQRRPSRVWVSSDSQVRRIQRAHQTRASLAAHLKRSNAIMQGRRESMQTGNCVYPLAQAFNMVPRDVCTHK